MSRWIKIISVIAVLCIAIVVAGVAILKSMDFNEYKGLIAEKASEATGRDLKIAGDLNLEISLNPSIAVEGVTFANASWGSKPEMVSIKRFAAEVSIMPLLSGTLDIKRVVLEGVNVLAETDKSGKGNWVFDTMPKKETAKKDDGGSGEAVLPVVRMVSVKDVSISYKDGVTGEVYDLVVSNVSVQADGADSPLALDVAGSVNGQVFTVAGNVGTINAMMAGGMFPLKLDVGAMATAIKLEGQVGTPDGKPAADLKLGVSIPKISDTVDAAATLVPALKDVVLPPVDTLNVSTNAKYAGSTLALSGLDLKFGSTDLSGKVSIGLGGGVPSIDGALSSNLINLDELLPKSDEKQAAAPAPAKTSDGKVFPADPLPLDGLKAANVKLGFTGKKIIVQGMNITDTSVDLSLQNGKLQVKPGATVFSGKISGDIALDGAAKTPALSAKLNVDQLDYGQALVAQDLKDIASGKVDVAVDVSGRGGSVRALMAGLNGKTRIVTENGRLESGALNIISTDLLNVLDSKDDKTLRCGVIHFDIKSGMANARAIVIETGGISVIGTGGVNLKTEEPKLRIDPRSKKANLASAAMVPVDIHGTLAKPDWTIDAAAAVGNVAAGAARTGAAVATLGLSLLVEKAVSSATGAAVDENDYCVPALAGKKVVPGETKSAEADTPAPKKSTSEPAPAPKAVPKVEDALEGIGTGLKGLFGSGTN
jgi:AsmA family protein